MSLSCWRFWLLFARLKRLKKGLTVTQLDSMCGFKHVLCSSLFSSAQIWVNLPTGKLTCPLKINGWNLEHAFPIEIHLGKLPWNLKIMCLKRKIIFQTFMFGFHVNFQGCSPFLVDRLVFGGVYHSHPLGLRLQAPCSPNFRGFASQRCF